jgi:site-specific DNA recombinase
MWMGGRVPPGYDLRERRLYINPAEAEQVCEIFRQYLRLRTVPSLMNHLIRIGIRTKVRISPGGIKTGGQPYSRGGLYRLLNNRIYIGEIEHKRSIHVGEHKGIVDLETWKQVQELLEKNRQGLSDRPRAQSGSMLTGLLFSENGTRYIPTNVAR